MNQLNVFNYANRYSFKSWFRVFKYAYQRVVRGYADCDIYNLDFYYLSLFEESLKSLAKESHGYPSEFDTYQNWINYLNEMAQKFYQANESNNFYKTPQSDKWYAWIEEHPAEDNPYINDMIEEENMNYLARQKDMQDGLDMMKKVFFDLWD